MNIKDTLKKYFGYNNFRFGQEEIINAILADENVLAILPTGAGKSICFQIPALLSENLSIIISPLISLMQDQVNALNNKEKIAAYINSTLDRFETEKVLQEINEGTIKLLYVAPEKLLNKEFQKRIAGFSPKYLFIDEAHCISEWGHNFRPSYRKIINFAKNVGNPKISAFTATATPEVKEDIAKQLNLDNPKIFIHGFERKNIDITIFETSAKKEKMLEILRQHEIPAIIYCSTRKAAEETSEFLISHDFKTQYYHAGLPNEYRKIIQDDFQTGRLDIITATNAFGMGIDKSDIRTVIHFNMPGSIENFYQEIGRAGRDGQNSKSFLLFDSKDISTQEYFINSSFPNDSQIKIAYDIICDFAQIGIGNSYKEIIYPNKNLDNLLKINNLSKALFSSAAAVLKQSDYLDILPPSADKIKIQIPPEELKKYIKGVAKNEYRDLLTFILRKYGSSVFEKNIGINISNISETIGRDEERIKNYLKSLDDIGILVYNAQTSDFAIRFKGTRIDSEMLEFDYSELKRKKKLVYSKLNKIQDFIFSEECRTRFILNYFGEIIENYKCGHCDNCNKVNKPNIGVNPYIEEKIIQTLHLSSGNQELKYLLRILRGTSNHISLKAYDTFASCQMYKKEEITSVIDYMSSRKMLSIFNNIVSLTEKALARVTRISNKQKESLVSHYENDLALFNILREIRKESAKKFNQSINLICPDKVLRAVSEIRPKSVSEILEIDGFTKRMLNKLGLELIEAVKDFDKNNPDISKKKIPEHLLNTQSLIKKGYSLFEISQIKKLPEAVISFEIESIIEFNPATEISNLIEKKEITIIKNAIEDLEEPLPEIKAKLPNKISYGKIRIVAAKLRTNL